MVLSIQIMSKATAVMELRSLLVLHYYHWHTCLLRRSAFSSSSSSTCFTLMPELSPVTTTRTVCLGRNTGFRMLLGKGLWMPTAAAAEYNCSSTSTPPSRSLVYRWIMWNALFPCSSNVLETLGKLSCLQEICGEPKVEIVVEMPLTRQCYGMCLTAPV